MALPLVADFTGAAGVLPDPPFKQAAGVNLNRDGSGHAVASINGSDAVVYDDSNTYTTAQKSKITAGSFAGHGTGNYYLYALCNLSSGGTTAGNGYWLWTDGGSDTKLNRLASGSETMVKSAPGVTFSTGDTFEIANDGAGNITVKQNGSVIAALSYTDTSPFTGGAPAAGVYNQDNAQPVSLSAWTADDVGTGGSDTLLAQVCM